MHVITARNVNDAIPQAAKLMCEVGVEEDSRNGPVLVSYEPVTTVYGMPQERVDFWCERDANPFFHLFESPWMLAGRDDVEYVEQFASNMRNFSDNQHTFWGAYGHRWRGWFECDQLSWAIARLKANPNDRRVVVQMWDGNKDPAQCDRNGKDVPCNLCIHLQIVVGKLNMTVFNRSNDIVWGAYGANVVHMSMLQEYIAQSIGTRIGRYWQISDNWHAYKDTFGKIVETPEQWDAIRACAYVAGAVKPFNLMSASGIQQTWDQDVSIFLDDPYAVGFRHAFFRKIATPMYAAHTAFRENDGREKYSIPLEILDQMPADNDWRLAATNWIVRRQERANRKD